MHTLSLLVRALLLLASYVGLCAALRVRFKLNRCIAPFTASCCIIVALMLGGMVGALPYALLALYLLGWVGLLYACRFKEIPTPPIIILLGFVAFLAIRFRGAHFWTNDDVSHWGLVARHLIRHDRFPDGGDNFVFFQSYPLGLAAFIYYICRPLAETEAMMIIAQNFLLGTLFLPMFSLVRGRKGIFYPIVAALFLMFDSLSLFQSQLGADLPQPFFAMGAAATIVYYRDDRRRACVSALPALAALAYVKSSGLFFALLTAILLIYVARRCGMRRRRLLAFALAVALLPVAAYLIWVLRIKLVFPAALETKHAVSLSAYAEKFISKGPAVIKEIAVRQLRAFYKLEKSQLLAIPLWFATSLVLFFAVRSCPAPQRKRYLYVYCFAIGAYLLWYASVFLMYVFSMPEQEALQLASFSRYNGTGLVYMVGIISILMLTALQREGALPLPLLRLGGGVSALCTLVILAMLLWPGQLSIFGIVNDHDSSYPIQRQQLAMAHREYDLADGVPYLVVFFHDESVREQKGMRIFYNLKYEFETSEICWLSFNEAEHPGEYIVGSRSKAWQTAQPMEYFADRIDDCAAVLILDCDPELQVQIDAFLQSYDGDTPVYRAYELLDGLSEGE